MDTEQIQGIVTQVLEDTTNKETEIDVYRETAIMEVDKNMGKFDKIDSLKLQLDSHRPLPEESVESLQKSFAVDMTYNSNAIEGNTLTLSETKVVIEDGIAIGGKTVREHLEALNHYEAIEHIESIVDSEEIGEDTIKNIHYLVMKGIDKEFAGKYRMANVVISGSEHVPPNYMQVPSDMLKLIEWYDEAKDQLHPVELAALFHFKFVFIHPFRDGNGRTARLLMNLILMQYGYPPVVIKVADRLSYFEALEKASTTGDTENLVGLIVGYLEDCFKKYLLIAGNDIDELDDESYRLIAETHAMVFKLYEDILEISQINKRIKESVQDIKVDVQEMKVDMKENGWLELE